MLELHVTVALYTHINRRKWGLDIIKTQTVPDMTKFVPLRHLDVSITLYLDISSREERPLDRQDASRGFSQGSTFT